MKETQPVPLFFLSGSVAIIAACAVYHIAARPEWTQAQALRNQWVPLLFAVIYGALGLWLDSWRRK